MRLFFIKLLYIPRTALIYVGAVLWCGMFNGSAQTQALVRENADNQTNNAVFLLSSVSNANAAVDGDEKTYSTLSLLALGNVYQQLEFTGTNLPSSSSKVHIKLGIGSQLLGVLNLISIQAYDGGTPVGSATTLDNLVSLINGENQLDIVLSPGVNFDAIRLTMSATLSVLPTINIYEAYFYRSKVTPMLCHKADDVIYGSTGNIAGGLNAVEDAYNSIDDNMTTRATVRVNVSAANQTYLTALFPGVSPAGDYVKLIIEDPGGSLLNATLLAQNFAIHTYLNNTDNGALALDSQVLQLSLLPGSSSKQILIYPVNTSFNRIEINMGQGLLKALDKLYVYEITRIAAPPIISGTTDNKIEFCENTTVSLSAANPISGHTYKWYAQETGGAALHTGTIYTPGNLSVGGHTYFLSETRAACSDESLRAKVEVIIRPTPGNAELTLQNIND